MIAASPVSCAWSFVSNRLAAAVLEEAVENGIESRKGNGAVFELREVVLFQKRWES